MTTPSQRKVVAQGGSAELSGAFCRTGRNVLRLLTAAVLAGVWPMNIACAGEASQVATPMETRIKALIPDLETYIRSGMKAFDVPGVAIGIVTGDRLVYAKGFGVRSKAGGAPVDTRTVFQIGSATKAFLATTIAIAADRGKLKWDDRVVDLDPEFQLKDPWVTREFRIFDLLAQRSGLPQFANDIVGILGADETAMIRSLRYVEPVSSFRSTFAYTNITHMVAGRIVAKLAGRPDWNAVLARELLEPLGMTESSYTAAAFTASANHAQGYLWTPTGASEVRFIEFPYIFGAAGDINSNVEDMAHWIRMQLANGTFEGRRIVSPENLAVTRAARVAAQATPAWDFRDKTGDRVFYANGWLVTQTPNGSIVWHNGIASGFGMHIGMSLDKNVGVIVMTNEAGRVAEAIGSWTFDRLLDNPMVDYLAEAHNTVEAESADTEKMFAKPANPRPLPSLAPLTGNFVSQTFGKAVLRLDGDALVLVLQDTGCQLKLDPWDGDVFAVSVVPIGRFATMAEDFDHALARPAGFAQLQIDSDGRLNLLRLSFFKNEQAYEFRRER